MSGNKPKSQIYCKDLTTIKFEIENKTCYVRDRFERDHLREYVKNKLAFLAELFAMGKGGGLTPIR